MRTNRSLLLGALLLAALPGHLAAQAAARRDPATPYTSWSEAARETAEAIGDQPLARPADGQYRTGDAVIVDDSGKRYRAHVIGVAEGRYEIQYDGFGPNHKRRFDAQGLLGYQPGYAPAQAAAGPARKAAFQVGHEVEVEQGGRWREGRIIGARAAEYRVHYDGQPTSADEWVPAGRLRFFPGGPVATRALAPGKYLCSASRYDAASGTHRWNPKGSFMLFPDGRYHYLGFAKPSPGRYRTDPATRVVTFTGGHLNGGEATPMVQRPGRIYLTAPGIEERWSCTAAG